MKYRNARNFSVFAVYRGSSVYIPNKLVQVSVCKIAYSWYVYYRKVCKIYSSIDSLLKEWDVIRFD